jgi:hypothetical protein
MGMELVSKSSLKSFSSLQRGNEDFGTNLVMVWKIAHLLETISDETAKNRIKLLFFVF